MGHIAECGKNLGATRLVRQVGRDEIGTEGVERPAARYRRDLDIGVLGEVFERRIADESRGSGDENMFLRHVSSLIDIDGPGPSVRLRPSG